MYKFLSRVAVILIVSLALVSGIGYAAYHYLPTAPNDDVADDLLKDDTYNILLCGVDGTRENADTIVLVSFDTKNKAVNLMSIPRDTMSNEDRYIKKINASYSVDHKGNIDQTIHEVEQVTGLAIDRYAITTFDGFEKAIDAIGGVEMYVPQDLEYSDPYQDLEINIKKGQQVLDGEHALQFVRFRSGYVTGDIGRIGAQQLFFKALATSFLDTSIVTKIPALAKVVSEEMDTDLTVSEMLWFFKQAQGLNLDSIGMYTLPGSPEYVDEISYYIPSAIGILELVNQKFVTGTQRITGADLNLVDMAYYTTDQTNDAGSYESGTVTDEELYATNDIYTNEAPENGYDNNGSYVGSGDGGDTYDGYNGAYTPSAETTTGETYRSTTTTIVNGEPTLSGNENATLVEG